MEHGRFDIGDLVKAKFGQTVMTVVGVVRGGKNYGYRTSWQQDDEQLTGTFPEDALERVPPVTRPPGLPPF